LRRGDNGNYAIYDTMKSKLFYVTLFLLIGYQSIGQIPNGFSFQAIIRNDKNELISNRQVTIRISFLEGGPFGTTSFQERHQVTTNQNGLAYLTVGQGIPLLGNISNINWAGGNIFTKAEVDPNGGTDYKITLVTPVLSVPYALYANVAEKLSKDITENDPEFLKSVAKSISSQDTMNWNNKLGIETDPLYRKSIAAGITAKDTMYWNSKFSAETDPFYKQSVAAGITAKDTIYWNRKLSAETDPLYKQSIAAGITAKDTMYWNSKLSAETDPLYKQSLAAGITAKDTMYWNSKLSAETDPLYKQSVAAGITSKDTMYWNSKLSAETDPLYKQSVAAGITSKDTMYWNSKLSARDTLSLSYRINTKLTSVDTASLSNRINNKLATADTISLSNRINAKLNPNDTLSLSNRIDAIIGLPPSGNSTGDILFWNGSSWVKLSAGQNGQVLQLINGLPAWAGAGFASLTTNAATAITGTTATVGGNIANDGGGTITERGVVYGTNPSPTVSNSKLIIGSGTGSFSGTISGLSPNTTYYTRAYATNSAGTAYGNELSFTTATVPAIVTNPISNITNNSANGGGNVTSDGGSPVTAAGLVYGISPSPTLSNSVLNLGSGTDTFSGTISGLSVNTTYYVRAFATNSAGTAYGNEVNFTTTGPPPTFAVISTNSITNIMNNSAVAGGNITSDGGSPVSARGVVYGTSPSPTLSNSVLNIGSGTGGFTGTITGLTPNTTYYVRAFATNGAGTAYGNEVSFTNLCGAFVASGVWKNFMCHNLGVANTSADPFTPSWEINGGYWQWGRKEMAAAGPSGSGAGQANSGAIAGWNSIYAANGSWSDAIKTNNDPCPVGFRVPTRIQWQGINSNNAVLDIGSSWLVGSATNYSTGKRFGDLLFLPAAGVRSISYDGALYNRGSLGYYWSSSEFESDSAWYLFFELGFATTNGSRIRTNGFSLRCIAE
jgi:uncharacterized protein (TIGR02145 family)